MSDLAKALLTYQANATASLKPCITIEDLEYKGPKNICVVAVKTRIQIRHGVRVGHFEFMENVLPRTVEYEDV